MQVLTVAQVYCVQSFSPGPVIPCHCFTGVEQTAIIHSSYNVTHHLPMKTEDFCTPLELCGPLSQLKLYYCTIPLRVCKFSLQHIHDSVALISAFL